MDGMELRVTDDYAVADTDDLELYFGYEETWCPVCEQSGDDCDCERSEKERCFVAKRDGEELMRVPTSELIRMAGSAEPVSIMDYMCIGLLAYIARAEEANYEQS